MITGKYSHLLKGLFLPVFALLFHAQLAFSQSFIWANRNGGNGNDFGYDITTDTSGNIYVTGTFGVGSSSFGGITVTGTGTHNIFVAKYDGNGNCLWVAKGDGELFPSAISLAPGGDIYITGGLSGTNLVGTQSVTALGDVDIFAARLDNSGNWKWVFSAGGPWAGTDDAGMGVAADETGCYVTGYFMYSVNIGSNALTTTGLSDMFLTRLDSSGACQWALQYGSQLGDLVEDIVVDKGGYLYLTGCYGDFMNFGSTFLSGGANGDIFVAKLDPMGVPIWVRTAEGPWFDEGNAIRTDDAGNVYLTGTFSDSVSFNGSYLISHGSNDIYVACYDTSGTFKWVVNGGTASIDNVYGLAVDEMHNSYISGAINAGFPVIFGTLTAYNPVVSTDICIAKCDSNGTWQWLKVLGGPVSDVAYGIASTGCEVAVTGTFGNYIGFDTISLMALSWDVFLTKVSTGSGTFCSTPAVALQCSDTSNCGKTCIDFFDLSVNNPSSWQWLFPGADSVTSQLQNPTGICYNSYGDFDVTLIACNSNGCDTLFLPGFIHIFPDPSQPAITISNDTLFCFTSSTAYQWYMDTTFIAGATDSIYVASQPGNYYVTVTDTNGCVAASNFILFTGIHEKGEELFFNLIPNPAQEMINIHLPEGKGHNIRIDLLDMTGRLIKQVFDGNFPAGNFDLTVPLKNINKGIYLIRVNNTVRCFVID